MVCPFNDDGNINVSCLQCRLRPYIDNWYFMIAYIIVLIFLYYNTTRINIAIYIIFVTIFVAYVFTCSYSGNLFIRAGEGIIYRGGIVLVLLYVGSKLLK